jgi:hypothetical protein
MSLWSALTTRRSRLSRKTTDLSAIALDAAQAVFEAKRGRTFDHAAQEFVRVLRTVPDYPPIEISADTIQALGDLSERVIEQIERHLSDDNDRESIQQDLARAVYDIRQALEEIDRWQRNYSGR